MNQRLLRFILSQAHISRPIVYGRFQEWFNEEPSARDVQEMVDELIERSWDPSYEQNRKHCFKHLARFLVKQAPHVDADLFFHLLEGESSSPWYPLLENPNLPEDEFQEICDRSIQKIKKARVQQKGVPPAIKALRAGLEVGRVWPTDILNKLNTLFWEDRLGDEVLVRKVGILLLAHPQTSRQELYELLGGLGKLGEERKQGVSLMVTHPNATMKFVDSLYEMLLASDPRLAYRVWTMSQERWPEKARDRLEKILVETGEYQDIRKVLADGEREERLTLLEKVASHNSGAVARWCSDNQKDLEHLTQQTFIRLLQAEDPDVRAQAQRWAGRREDVSVEPGSEAVNRQR